MTFRSPREQGIADQVGKSTQAEPGVVYVRAQTHLAKDRQKGVLTDIVIKLTETRCGGPQGELCSLLMLLKRFYLRLTTALMTCKKLSQ